MGTVEQCNAGKMFPAFVFAGFIIFIDIRCFTICVNGMADLFNQLVAV